MSTRRALAILAATVITSHCAHAQYATVPMPNGGYWTSAPGGGFATVPMPNGGSWTTGTGGDFATVPMPNGGYWTAGPPVTTQPGHPAFGVWSTR